MIKTIQAAGKLLCLLSLLAATSPANAQAQRQPAKSAADSAKSRPAPTARGSLQDDLVLPSASGYSINDPLFKRLYGPGVFVMDALADINIGVVKGQVYLASHRFRSPVTGKVKAAQLYWAAGAGYSAGNGGTISLRIYPDDGSTNHFPNLSASPLATGIYTPGLLFGRHIRSSFNDSVAMGSVVALETDKIYHLVYENIDADPAGNYIGVNNVVTVERNGRPARWLNPIDWATLIGYKTAQRNEPLTWRDASLSPSSGLYYAPILQLTLNDGTSFGAADIETGNIEGAGLWTIEASQPIRERFTPAADRLISGFSIHTSTPTGGQLQWSILQGETVLATGVISEPSANYGSQFNTRISQGVFKWYDVPLPTKVQFKAGTTYDLQFKPIASSQWRLADEYNGSDQRFDVSFSQSQAQTWVSGNWINANHRKHIGAGRASNWRIVLHSARS